MRFQRVFNIVFVLILVVCMLFTATQGKKLFGKSKPKQSPYPTPYKPKSPGISKGKLAAGALVGAGVGIGAAALAVHATKKNNPCAFHGSGMTNTGELESAHNANQRCTEVFTKYRNDLTKCPGATGATCTEIGGDTKCAVTMEDGTNVPIFDCA